MDNVRCPVCFRYRRFSLPLINIRFPVYSCRSVRSFSWGWVLQQLASTVNINDASLLHTKASLRFIFVCTTACAIVASLQEIGAILMCVGLLFPEDQMFFEEAREVYCGHFCYFCEDTPYRELVQLWQSFCLFVHRIRQPC